MSVFNFDLSNSQPTSTHQPRLKPWNIYKVKFDGCRVEHIKGVKDPDKTYDILKVRFSNDEGYYEESVFFPKDDDAVRPKYTNKEGHEYEGASSFERTMTFVAQVAEVLNPEGFKKMQSLSGKFKNFNDVCNVLIKITDPKKGTETNLKLVGRVAKDGTVNPALPKFCAVNKEGKLFTSDNFIGDKLFFSPYEEGKRNEYLNAKPTKMEEALAPAPSGTMGSEDTDDFDFDKMLGGIE